MWSRWVSREISLEIGFLQNALNLKKLPSILSIDIKELYIIKILIDNESIYY